MTLTYHNRGADRSVEITEHARKRFAQRWHRVRMHRPNSVRNGTFFSDALRDKVQDPAHVDEVIAFVFKQAGRVTKSEFGRKTKQRDKRRGGGDVRFRAVPFEFIICDSRLVTVELIGECRPWNSITIKALSAPAPT